MALEHGKTVPGREDKEFEPSQHGLGLGSRQGCGQNVDEGNQPMIHGIFLHGANPGGIGKQRVELLGQVFNVAYPGLGLQSVYPSGG